jgi:GAF domain-containing protein
MAASATGLTGAGIMLMSDSGPRGSLCTTDDVSRLIEELQYALGEGPCIDAYRQDRAVLEPDLVAPEVFRWPAFSGPAVESGVRAVFGFPIRIGAVRLGALNLYRNRTGPLTAEQHTDSLAIAGIVAEAILALQADADVGEIAEALEIDSDFHYVVHQASGMVAVQLGISIEEAAVRLRAYAFSSGMTLADVAKAVVERHLRFDQSDGPGESR